MLMNILRVLIKILKDVIQFLGQQRGTKLERKKKIIKSR